MVWFCKVYQLDALTVAQPFLFVFCPECPLLLQPSESLSQKEKEREKQNPPLKSPPLEKRKEKKRERKRKTANL